MNSKNKGRPCSVENCLREATRKEMCRIHYRRTMRNGHPGTAEARYERPPNICIFDDCSNRVAAHSFCRKLV